MCHKYQRYFFNDTLYFIIQTLASQVDLRY